MITLKTLAGAVSQSIFPLFENILLLIVPVIVVIMVIAFKSGTKNIDNGKTTRGYFFLVFASIILFVVIGLFVSGFMLSQITF